MGEGGSRGFDSTSSGEKCILLEWEKLLPRGGGGKEYRELKLSQFVKNKDHWKYAENGSKAFRGGVGYPHRENKVIRQYPCPDAGRACHVHLLDLYFSKLSEGAKEKGAFYFTPLRKTPADPKKPWFTDVPIGWNKLDRFVRDMCEEVGIERKSNHSLKVTGGTRLYRSGVAERTIQARTGHKSIEALRIYERPGERGDRDACNALADISNSTALVPCRGSTNSQPIATYPSSVGFKDMCSAFAPPFAPSFAPSFAPPSLNFSGCSVNVYTGPVMIGVFNMCIIVQCYNMQFSLYTCRKMFSCEN